MKIMYIITSSDMGGAQKYVLDLAKYFQGSIASGSEHKWLEKETTKQGIKYHKLTYLKRRLNPWYDLLALLELYRLIKMEKPDLVHTNSSKAGVLGSIAAKLLNIKVVFTAHGMFYFSHPNRLVRTLYKITEKFASYFRDGIIFVSEHDKSAAVKFNIASQYKFFVIHNGIQKIDFLDRNKARTKLGIEDNQVIFGNIANQYHRKGLDILLDAVSELRSQSPYKFILIGEGPETDNLKAQAKRLDIENKIIFFKPIANVKDLLKAFDVFVLSSRYEGFPYVLLEACMASLPIVCTTTGGNREAAGEGALYVKTNDKSELASALNSLIDDHLKRKALGDKSFKHAIEFSLTSMIQKTQEVYKVISQKPN